MAITTYATVQDIRDIWRSLTTAEEAKAQKLLEIVSSEIRMRARDIGKDFDDMLSDDPDLAYVARSVCVDVVKRFMNDNMDTPAMSQMSQSAGGYSVSGTFLVPGGGLFLKRTELQRLGLKRQKVGVIDLCG